ncbi:hypothetical protein JCM16303_003993 [Sporobolomyces ruberrimus]
MELDAASQAQLAAFLLAQSQVAQLSVPSTSNSPFDPAQALAALQWGNQGSSVNSTELDGWLQEQLNALTQLPLNLPLPPHPQPLPLSNNHPVFSQRQPVPAQPHAFPPISNSRFHPYDRHQTKHDQPLPAPERQRWHSQPTYESHHQTPTRIYEQQPQQIPLYSPPSQPKPPYRTPILYPPDDTRVILTPAPTPQSAIAHSLTTTPMDTSSSSPSSFSPPLKHSSSKASNRTIPKRRRTRSLPSFPSSFSLLSDSKQEEKTELLEDLFDWMDERRWNLSGLLTALSETPTSLRVGGVTGMEEDSRTPTHRRRIREFLNLDSSINVSEEDGGQSWESHFRRWKREKKQLTGRELDLEDKGADEIVRMWEEQGGLGRKQEREKGMEDAVKELHLNGGQRGPVAGVAIRSVINRYHEAYNESQADIARLDAALSRAPSPHLSSAPREPAAWSGHLVVPPLQADLLSHWLMSPGRPDLQEERSKGSIEADHMRIYSSLSPLDLHARGAEICRSILARDESTRNLFGQHWDSIHLFVQGPSIAPIDTAGFNRYDDYSLWHHALMCYLQLCVRYPAFKESKEAHIVISPDLPPPLHPTALETSLIDRLLRSHWDYLRLYLLNEHGGLLRSAVRGFEGVKLSRFDLLSVVGDTIEVIEALKKSRDTSDRILPYDSSVSQVRNAWRQTAFWDPQASWVTWSAATTHFLELSALNKEWALGVKDLPGIEGLLGGSSSKTAASQALR